MAGQPLNCRYEIKMECSQSLFAQAQSWVTLSSAAFRRAYPTRWVNNLYFDTPGFDSYNDHIESASERRKLRFRWYGPDLEHARGQLELKSKTERVGWKVVQPIDADFDLRACDWFDFQQALGARTGQMPDRLFDELVRASSPLVINRYLRDYSVSADENIRLTLDYRMSAYEQMFSPRPNLDFPLQLADIMIIEFKCAVEHARQLADVLADFPLRVNRHSKYVAALDAIMER